MNTLILPIPAADLLPHRGPMLLLDEITDCHEGMVRGGTRIAANHVLAGSGGEVEPVALIEILAQAAAALKGCEADVDGDGRRPIGFLVGLKRLRISMPAHVGDSLVVELRRTTALGRASVMEGRVLRGDDWLASGALNVWEEDVGATHRLETGATHPEQSNEPALAGSSERPSDPKLTRSANLEYVSPMHRAVCACLSRSLKPARSCASRRAGKARGSGLVGVGEFCFDESFIGFQGHFPGYAILPGIVTLKAALILCEELVGHPARLIGIERAKFAGRVRPSQHIRVRVQVSPDEDTWRVAAVIVEPRTDVLILKLNATVAGQESGHTDEKLMRA